MTTKMVTMTTMTTTMMARSKPIDVYLQTYIHSSLHTFVLSFTFTFTFMPRAWLSCGRRGLQVAEGEVHSARLDALVLGDRVQVPPLASLPHHQQAPAC